MTGTWEIWDTGLEALFIAMQETDDDRTTARQFIQRAHAQAEKERKDEREQQQTDNR